MLNQFSRTELILGKENVNKIRQAKVAVFGLGGVGSFVVEGLTRAGVENFILVDNDTISITNLNRQLFALNSTIGKNKVDVAKARILDINPNAKVEIHKEFVIDNFDNILDKSTNYIVDAIDTISAKINLVQKAKEINVPIISSMGTGNKLDPTKLEVTDIKKTSICPVAKILRKELKNRNIDKLKVVYSTEAPILPNKEVQKEYIEYGENERTPGSVSFVPSVAGLIIAGEVIKDLIKE
jgi:tRNA threonylcarbamoyladenosine dehydratase